MTYKAIYHFAELIKSFVTKLRNLVESTELKMVPNQSHETICASQNLKSFGERMQNF